MASNSTFFKTLIKPATIAIVIGLLYASFSGDIWRSWLAIDAIKAIPYLSSAIVTLGDIALMLMLLWVLAKLTWPSILRMAGLNQDFIRPFIWSAVVFVPVLVMTIAAGAPLADITLTEIIWPSIFGPFSEEFFYRGIAVAVLMRVCLWPMWRACLLPALFFGIAHLWQGDDWMSIAGVVAITSLGGLLFGWLFVRWNYNLWPPVLLHIGMNTLWTVFALGENAIGGWLGNALRLVTVIIAIVATFRMMPSKSRPNQVNTA